MEARGKTQQHDGGVWRCGAREVSLRAPVILGILNVTPDSFSDGGKLAGEGDALRAAVRMVREGAQGLDIGGESTRPGAAPVSEAEELTRVLPVVRACAKERERERWTGVVISIDTTKPSVARAALDAGADVVNDVSAGLLADGGESGMLDVAAKARCGLVLMHRARVPARDAYSDKYAAGAGGSAPMGGDVCAQVRSFLAARAAFAVRAGVGSGAIALDPGLGFGKSVEQNLALLWGAGELGAIGFPVLSALSRKSFVGRLGLGRDSTPDERLPATLAMSTLHLLAGASIFRVHDVAAHRQALDAASATLRNAPGVTGI